MKSTALTMVAIGQYRVKLMQYENGKCTLVVSEKLRDGFLHFLMETTPDTWQETYGDLMALHDERDVQQLLIDSFKGGRDGIR